MFKVDKISEIKNVYLLGSRSPSKLNALKKVFGHAEVESYHNNNTNWTHYDQPIGLDQANSSCRRRVPQFLSSIVGQDYEDDLTQFNRYDSNAYYIALENYVDVDKYGTYGDYLYMIVIHDGEEVVYSREYMDVEIPKYIGKMTKKARSKRTWATFLFDDEKKQKDPHEIMVGIKREDIIANLLRSRVIDDWIIQSGKKNGVKFYSFENIYNDKVAYNLLLDHFEYDIKSDGVPDIIYGLEARGLHLAGALAARLRCGFGHIRKAGKLLNPCASVTYDKEYGRDELEVSDFPNSFSKKDVRVILVDDIIATGGTIKAAAKLFELESHHVDIKCYAIGRLTKYENNIESMPDNTSWFIDLD